MGEYPIKDAVGGQVGGAGRRGACPCLRAPSLAGFANPRVLNRSRRLRRTPCGVRGKDSGRPREPRNGECAGPDQKTRPRGWWNHGPVRSPRTRAPRDLRALQRAARGVGAAPAARGRPVPSPQPRAQPASPRGRGGHVEGRGGSSARLPESRRGEERRSMRSQSQLSPPIPVFSGVFQGLEEQRLKFTAPAHPLLPSLRLMGPGLAISP